MTDYTQLLRDENIRLLNELDDALRMIERLKRQLKLALAAVAQDRLDNSGEDD